jgi:protein-disulfide isomerase
MRLPDNQSLVAIANLTGLQDWAAAHGVPHAKSNECLSDLRSIKREVQRTDDVLDQYPEFTGTPAFVVNGKMLQDVVSWDKLQPQLEAGLA